MTANTGNRRILLIERYPDELEAAFETLEGSGYRCVRHLHEHDPFEHIGAAQADGAILGASISATYRRNALRSLRCARSEIPVILILPSHASDMDMMAALGEGIDRCLHTHVPLRVLLAYVRALFRRVYGD